MSKLGTNHSCLPLLSLCAALAVAGCGGSKPTVDNDDDPRAEPEMEPSGAAGGPATAPTGPVMDSPDPILPPPEEPDVQVEPSTEPAPAPPCERMECSPGQRCEESGDIGTCVDNTCDDLTCSAMEVCEAHEAGGFVCSDNSCVEDVDCAPEEFCAASGVCEADVCVAETLSCVGQEVFKCNSGGGSDDNLFTCGSPAYFESTCQAGGPDTTGCSCEDDWDCPAFTNCEVDLCQGTGTTPQCRLPPVAFADTPPTIEIHWGGDSSDNDLAHDGSPEATPAPWPESSHVQSTPMVVNLDDDNGDGLINELDFPEIIFVTYAADNGDNETSILRAIHGGGPNKGKDMFAVCSDLVWTAAAPFDTATTPCAPSQAELPSRNTAAIGDLDRDGTPEIVYVNADGAIRILNNFGSTIYLSPPGLVEFANNTSFGVQPSIADLDHTGFPEIVIGREVYTLNISDGLAPVGDAGAPPVPAGGLMIEHHFLGTGTRGQHGDEGPTSCVADIHPDAGMEILAGTTLYRMPALTACAAPPCDGTLDVVWDANALNTLSYDEGYCAVADVWGADHAATARPGPDNPLDGAPEAILVSNGYLQILDGATGALILEQDMDPANTNNNRWGGAPNIDDFDGDGYMEIASATEGFYIVVDLQAESASCPAWPDPLERIVMVGVSDNPNVDNGLLRDPGADCAAGCNDGAVCNANDQCVCLHNGWLRNSDDASSRVTSSSVFDFNGDGTAEVLYNDECEFRVFDGPTGQILYNEVSRSRTAMENPVVADVDNDGNAEAVTVLNTEQTGRCDDDEDAVSGPNGLRVWGDPQDTWVSARRIWNQFAYHVTNVTEGGAIPVREPESWRDYNGHTYNTYRSQPRAFGVAPDLQVTGVSLSSPDVACGELGDTLEIAFEITNAGDLRVGPGVEVSFYGVWDDMEAVLMGPSGPLTYVIQGSLEPGRSLIGSVVFDIVDQGETMLPTQVRVEVDTGGADGSDFGAERECVEDNNDNFADVLPGEPRPDLSILVGEATVDCTENVATVTVTITNSGTADATGIVLEIYAGDPNAGGTSMIRIPIDNLAAGESTTIDAVVPGFPNNREIILWGVVDPDNTITECNEADNADPADNPILCRVGAGAR